MRITLFSVGCVLVASVLADDAVHQVILYFGLILLGWGILGFEE